MKNINFFLADSNVFASDLINVFYSIVSSDKYKAYTSDISPVLSDKYIVYIDFKNKSYTNNLIIKDGILKIKFRDEALDYYSLDIISYDRIFDKSYIERIPKDDSAIKMVLNYFSRVINKNVLSFVFVDNGVLLLLDDTFLLLLDYHNPLFYMFVSFLSLYFNRYIVIDENMIRSSMYYMYSYYYNIFLMAGEIGDYQITFICRDDNFYLPVSLSILDLKIDVSRVTGYFLDSNGSFVDFSFLEDGSLGPVLNHKFFTFRVDLSKMLLDSKKDILEKGEAEFRNKLIDLINKKPELKDLIDNILKKDE
ncbi:MAG: hypothetical protein QXF12_00170 [Candidatus Aenigmatarchaeota archaeon]